AKVSFKEPKSLPVPQASPPTFLFLLIFNCQITDQIPRSKFLDPKPKSSGTNQHLSQSARNSRAKVFVASSAAALVQ
ncbi:hypothetical protein, partial [Rhizobium cauense]|uniref:hypothetical protein n=1 Tax=Rhizobium cauense TaxID=1166683 RepID=UPI001C6E4D99